MISETVSFDNSQLDVSSLPRVEAVAFSPAHRDYWALKLMGWVIRSIFLLAVAGVVISFGGWWNWTVLGGVMGGWVVLAGLDFWLRRLGYLRLGHALRQHDILFRRGVIFQTTTAIPFRRIQHADVSQGFLERQFELAHLNVYTAGGSGSDISIPGLQPDDAERLRDYVVGEAARAREEDPPAPSQEVPPALGEDASAEDEVLPEARIVPPPSDNSPSSPLPPDSHA